MATILYKTNKNTKEVYSIYVSGIDPTVKGYVIQKFLCENGVWYGYYNNGAVTYPKKDWRYGRVDKMKVAFDVKENLWDFEYSIRRSLGWV